MIAVNRSEIHRSLRLKAGLVLACIFVAERIVLAIAGIRFNIDALTWYWQVLDPILLKDHLAESLFFLHAQPPLFNLMVGLALHFPTNAAHWLLHGFFIALGLVLAVTLYLGLVEMDWPPRIAVLTVAVAALTPGWIVYENWLFYDFPVMVLLAVAFVGLLRSGRSEGVAGGVLFIVAVTSIALTRSLFHLVWLVISITIVILFASRPTRRRLALAVGLSLVIVVGWYAKNAVVFGFFGPSSWLGFSLAKTSTARLDPGERQRMVSAGVLSPLALVEPFSPLQRYQAAGEIDFPDCRIAALGQREKSTGHPNFNHIGFVAVSARCRSDALEVIRARPSVYLGSISTAVRRFFSSAVAYPPFLDNLVVMAPLFYLGEATWGRPAFLVVSFFSALVISIISGLRARRSKRGPEVALWFFTAWTLFWVLCVGSLLEVGENHRFRFLVTPLVWLTLADQFRRWSNRLRRP